MKECSVCHKPCSECEFGSEDWCTCCPECATPIILSETAAEEVFEDEIEATVVISLFNPAVAIGKTIHLWECSLSPLKIAEYAEIEAMRFAEQCGQGHTNFRIYNKQ